MNIIMNTLAGAFLAMCALCLWEHHELSVTRGERDTAIESRDKYKDAATTNSATVATLTAALNACKAKVVTFANANDRALHSQDEAHTVIASRLTKQRDALAASNDGTCRAWAEAPACGVGKL
jgi:hypothetical protein